MKRLRRYLVAGILVWLPLAVTIIVIRFLLEKVLLIEYPRKGLYSLAFQTASQLQEVQAKTAEDVICVFLPTTPNPTSGFIFLVPRDDVIELDMSVDDAVKMIMSLGVVVPQWQAEQTGELPLKLPDDTQNRGQTTIT